MNGRDSPAREFGGSMPLIGLGFWCSDYMLGIWARWIWEMDGGDELGAQEWGGDV